MYYLLLLIAFPISFLYIYILGIILLRCSRKNEVPHNFYKRNIILAATTSLAVFIIFFLTGGFVIILIGVVFLFILSLIYLNVDLPICFPNIKENRNKQEIILSTCLVILGFITLSVILHFFTMQYIYLQY